jgi:hypothetical protein
MIGQSCCSTDMSLKPGLLELHVPYPRLFSAKRPPSPALETHSHASAYTDQDAYRSASHHARKPSSYMLASYSPLANVATLLPTDYPRCNIFTTCREVCCLPTSRLCLSVRHARATLVFPPFAPGMRLAYADMGVSGEQDKILEASVKAYKDYALEC